MKTWEKYRLACFAVIFILFLLGCGGCASSGMKGTPFYTGEYSVRQDQDEDRVNLWPLLYYHDPALSILWPFIEISDDRLAVRPLMSIYGRDTDAPVYNVLWPIAKFDTKTDTHRIFPFFWGEDYFVGFPLYWHFDDPWKGSGYDGLFPLWSYSSYGKNNYNANIVWPFLQFKNHGDETGWRVWPLAGSYNSYGDRYQFAAWPLAHQWSSSDDSQKGSCIFPLYYHQTDNDDSLFISLPYSRGKGVNSSWETVLPLYHRSKSTSSSSFYSLLYSSGEDQFTDEKWNLTVPLWYSKSSQKERLVATLLGGYMREGEERSWLAIPAFSWGRKDGECSDVWVGGPLAHFGKEGQKYNSHIFPFYYRSQDENSRRFYSLVWSTGENEDGSKWQLLPPFMYRSQDGENKSLITPLYAQGVADDGETNWRTIAPLVYNRKTQDENLVASLLGGWHRKKGSLSWVALPLLSGGKVTEDSTSFWTLPPLIHGRWNGEHSAHQVLPLYYWNGWSKTFMSLPLSRWEHGGKKTTAVPLTLSWLTSSDDCSDLWLLGPLAHFSWGKDASTSHIFPVYYHNKKADESVSLAFCKWEKYGRENWLYPPLLSLYTTEGETNNLYSLLGLFRQQWGGDADKISRLWPLYDYRENDHFLSLLFGWGGGSDGYVYPFTPLFGLRRGDYSGGWVFPLWSRRKHRETGAVSGTFLWGGYKRDKVSRGSEFIPFYDYERLIEPSDTENLNYSKTYGTRFWSLPFCWYSNLHRIPGTEDDISITPNDRLESRTKAHGAFPFWSYSKTADLDDDEIVKEHVDGSILLFLYDYRHDERKRTENTDSLDYTRARVLWRLWHYERENGNVTVDIFPAITIDKKKNGFRKYTFIWRLFRYENGPRGKKLDLLFVPIIRSKNE